MKTFEERLQKAREFNNFFNMNKESILIATKALINNNSLPVDDVHKIKSLFNTWKSGDTLIMGDFIVHNGDVYEILVTHMSNTGLEPDIKTDYFLCKVKNDKIVVPEVPVEEDPEVPVDPPVEEPEVPVEEDPEVPVDPPVEEPEVPVEEDPIPLFDEILTYSIGDIVKYNDINYISLVDENETIPEVGDNWDLFI